jgi:CheY-like chemotaxis protein
MPGTRDAAYTCPYCGRPLHWTAGRWFGRGCFECDACGEFPDMGAASSRANQDPRVQAAPRLPPRRDNRPRVLLVDDSAEHRDLYALMLEPTATVITASGGEEALSLAPAAALDIIVLDVLMPNMDGWEVCRRLKAHPGTSGVPIIMLTSLDEGDLAWRAHRSGAAAVLIKPCPVERLAATITDSLGKSAARTAGRDALPSRRWVRKPVVTPVAIRVGELPARLLNISYGGFCVELEGPPNALPQSFEFGFPREVLGVRAEAVWLRRNRDEHWLCGARVWNTTDGWRGWVDGISSVSL